MLNANMIHPVIEGEFLVAHLTADTIMGHVAKDIFEAMGARANLSNSALAGNCKSKMK